MATFDGPNKIITLEAPVSGALAVGVEDIYSDWKVWSTLSDNLKYLPAFRTIGGDDLTPGITAGAYFFLRNDTGWRLKTTEEDQSVYLSGNLAPEDASLPILLATTGAYTVGVFGLQPVTQAITAAIALIQTNQYNGQIVIDAINGLPGTAFPVGTEAVPCDNLADALTLATSKGFIKFRLRSPIVFTAAPGITIWQGEGSGAEIDLGGQDMTDVVIRDCIVDGVQAGGSLKMERCTFTAAGAGITAFNGTATECLLGNTISFISGGVATISSGQSFVPGGESPSLDGTAGPVDLTLRNYNGGVRLSNFTSASTNMTIGLNTGKINVSASCTDLGDAHLRGVCIVNNESDLVAGTDYNDDATINKTLVDFFAEDIDGFTFKEVNKILLAVASGDVEQATDGTYTIKSPDGLKDRVTGDDAANGGRTITGRDVT
ncbi:MAG: hypothetical protein HN683_04660 [Gammaproteobacteria bacterium]|jgi:hypothetical protein|nr:hypothetical protein [Gammaproteobacteria bacterium]